MKRGAAAAGFASPGLNGLYALLPRKFVLPALWGATLLLIAAVALIAWHATQDMVQRQQAEIQGTLSNLTRVQEERTSRILAAADQTLGLLSARYVAEGPGLNLRAMVEQGVIDARLYEQVGIIDANGLLQASSVPFAKGLNLSDREHFQVHRDGRSSQMQVSKPVLGGTPKQWTIALTRRIFKTDGSFGGVAVASIRSSTFTRFLAELDLPANSVAALIGQDGVYRAQSMQGSEDYGPTIALASFFRQPMVEGATHVLLTAPIGDGAIEHLLAYRQVPDYPLLVATAMSTKALRDMTVASRQVLIWQATALVILIALLAALMSIHLKRMYREMVMREHLESGLRRSEERLEMAMDGGALGIWDWNLRDRAASHSAQVNLMLGYRAGEINLADSAAADLVHPEDAGAVRAALLGHLKGETRHFFVEFRMRHKSGQWVWISTTGEVLERDGLGRAERVLGIVRDVTAKVVVAQALAESEERWKGALNGADEGIWDWNVSDGSRYASDRFVAMLGYPFSGEGPDLYDMVSLLHPDDIDQARRQMQLHFRGESDHYFQEMRLRCRDGSYKWTSVRGRAIRGAGGQVVRVSGSARDCSEQRMARDQIEDRSAQLDAIFSLSTDAFISFDRGMRVKYTNPAFELLTGLAGSAVLGLEEDALAQMMNARCTAEQPFDGFPMLRRLHHDPQPKHRKRIEIAGSPRRMLELSLRTSDSATVAQIVYLRDVTHETIVEKMKSEFLATAAHELRTPMAGILGFSEVLLTHDLGDEQRKEFLNIILRQSYQMKAILDELLDLARIEARRDKDFVVVDADLRVLVHELISGFSLPPARLAPSVDLSATPCRVDLGKARQAILNVLSNAYKYSPPGTRISITATASCNAVGKDLVGLCIRDEGIGMHSEVVARICERFFRADRSGATPGTGLGMSIVKEIMDLHGGELVVDSAPGLGTSVSLLFPAADGTTMHAGASALQVAALERHIG